MQNLDFRSSIPRSVRSTACGAVLLLALLWPSITLAWGLKPSGHVRVPMRDGTKLATDYYLPEDGPGPWPVVLIRSTYGRAHASEGTLKRGYAMVIQDARGLGASRGESHVFYSDGWRPGRQDGADTVDWVIRQPWCNGKVGTTGGSALAMTQILLAPTTTAVSAQSLGVCPANFYHDVVYTGGVLRKSLVENWLRAMGQSRVIEVYRDVPYYNPFWSHYNTLERAPDISAPAFLVGGWYDIFQQGTIDAFVEREKNGGEGARGKNYLVITWAPHNGDVTKDYAYGDGTRGLDIGAMRRGFFDACLKGDSQAMAGIPKVHYYVYGDDKDPGAPGNEWRSAETWPPFTPKETLLYLDQGGTMLREPPKADSASLGYTFDPKDPCPTLGGANLAAALPSGPFDQRKLSTTRTDILAFASAPLEAPIEVTGRVKVVLHVSSDAPDTDFTAKLLDIYPEGDGRELNVLDGIRRVKMREGFDRPLPLLQGPDEVVTVEIDLWSTSWVFNRGHRIGLHVSSSNHPRFEVNANTGADHPSDNGYIRVAHNRVHCDARYPSALILPIRD